MKVGSLIVKYAWVRESLLFLFLVLVTCLNDREDFYSEHGWIDGIFVFMLLYIHVQIHRFLVLPLLDRRRYAAYILGATILVLLFSALALITDFYFTHVGWFDEIGSAGIGYLLRFYLFSFSITVPLIIAVHSVFKEFEQQIKTERDKSLLAQMELNLLKRQTDPHFLFNALNGLYGLSLEKPEMVTDKILQLSDMMRYHIQWADVQWIDVKQEIDYLRQYIDFETGRRSNYVTVQATMDVEPQVLLGRIAPMILIFFVENAFKHVRSYHNSCYITINMYSKGDMLLFSVTNTYDENQAKSYSLHTGIDNVKRRLDIIYTNNYTLDIAAEDGLFHIRLKLQLI